MRQESLDAFSKIPQPDRGTFGFIEDVKKPLAYHFQPGSGCAPGETLDCMKNGAAIRITFPESADFPETAFVSLRRVLNAKGITEKPEGYPLLFERDQSLSREEYRVRITKKEAAIAASDPDGLRRAVYFLEDRICEAEGASATAGEWIRKPFVKHRVSRCFFGPTNRPPFYIDELMNDVDYYPEEYLNKLAHEGVNGLWLTMYFRDLPSSIFPGRGKDAAKRLDKLRRTVEKCGRYGIRIYVFLSEPKGFGDGFFNLPLKDAEGHPELIGRRSGTSGTFCVSSKAGMQYLKESMDQIFRAVPQLGGVINIMLGEDNGSCVAEEISNADGGKCPLCSQRDPADIMCDLATMFADTIHQYNPDAEYIGWFYAPSQRDGSDFMKRLSHVADKWPENATLMFNFESGGTSWQLGKKRIVFDYSLAYVGPSELFAQIADKAPRSGAKLQVGCSHEDASVPFIPVPENLYDKYRFMHEHKVSAAMQCWYFGNYPGLMNKAAGELSFEPFPSSGREFLLSLARPEWRQDSGQVVKAWEYFSQAYRKFPSNLAFEWYGPLHHSIVWPLHLFPADAPIAPSWLLTYFPEISGDRIGECLSFHHTLSEAAALCTDMSETWQRGMEILETLRSKYKNNPERLADIDLAAAIGLQMKSTSNLLRFYMLREDMLFCKNDHLEEMKEIVLDELANTEEMFSLCKRDSRLGYHSEAEGYLFFPEKLRARFNLLQELLTEDFPKFRIDDPEWDRYTGKKPEGTVAVLHRKGAPADKFSMGNGIFWQGSYDDDEICFTVHGMRGSGSQIFFALEPCRMWASYWFIIEPDESVYFLDTFFPDSDTDRTVHFDGEDISFSIARKHFDGFYREGFPMRMNIWGEKGHWAGSEAWPARLMHHNFNPAAAGWLVLD